MCVAVGMPDAQPAKPMAEPESAKASVQAGPSAGIKRALCAILLCVWLYRRLLWFKNPILLGGVLAHLVLQTAYSGNLQEARSVVGDLTKPPSDGTEWERLCRYLDMINGYLLKYSGNALLSFAQPLYLLGYDLWQRRDLPILALQRVGMVLVLCVFFCLLVDPLP